VDIKQLDMVLNHWIRDKQSEATLKEAEARNSTVDSGGGEDKGRLDAEGEWLLGHAVEGVDFTAALALYGNSGAAYIPVLRSFVTHTPRLFEKMDVHLESSPPDYTVEVHGFKGTCNAVCAEVAGALARELELASKEGTFDLVRERHGELRRMALELMERLGTLLEEWDGGLSSVAKERREEPEGALLARLSSAAAGFNSNGIEEVLRELEQYRYEKGGDLVLWLRERAEQFDYDAIHRKLKEILGKQ
jgi:HPt (histidine-containing phosphotransfer) domain-containing protein